jgi:hypothetical protein
MTTQEQAERRYLRAAKNGSTLANVLLGDGNKKNTPADKAAAVSGFVRWRSRGIRRLKDFLQMITEKGG